MQNTVAALRSRVRSLGASAADGKNIVAFSGGVDSSLVAALVHHVFPGSSQACVGVSSALPTAQLDLARSVASHIGIPLTEVSTTEGSDPDYIANEGQSCFHCKTHLYSALEAVAAQAGVESRRGSSETVGAGAGAAVGGRHHAPTPSSAEAGAEPFTGREQRKVVLFNGTNKDDKRDTTRVGLKAAANFQVASPIDMLTKAEVRAVARELGLPNWNHAASPCLRSRLAFGVHATQENLVLVEKAEDAARKRLRLGVSHNLRVRAMHGNKALLEVDAGEVLDEAVRSIEDLRSLILPLGFSEVDVRAFRSGAVSGGATTPDNSSSPVHPGGLTNQEKLWVAGGVPAGVVDGVEVYRVEGTATAAGAARPHE